MKETTAQQRMDLLTEIANEIRGAAQVWTRRWHSPRDGEEIHLVYRDDGTVMVELNGDEVLRVQVEVTASVVDYVDLVNKPAGFVLSRPWGQVPSGWFVRVPGGSAWYEVIAVTLEGGTGRLMVTLDVNGTRGTWQRDPDAKVDVRRGTRVDAMSAAVDTLMDAGMVEAILDDQP